MQYFDYYLIANTKEELLEDLYSAGFKWYDTDETGGNPTEREPKRMEVISVREVGSCIYLEHIVETDGTYDEEGNVITPTTFTDTFHANVRMLNETSFRTSTETPNKPRFRWA